MTDNDFIIIFTKDVFSEKNLQKFTDKHNDPTTRIIIVPSEYTEKVERL